MFYDKFLRFNEDIIEDDYKMLKSDGLNIDFNYIENVVHKMLSTIKALEKKYMLLSIPRLSANYELKEEQFVQRNSNPVEKVVIEREQIEKELKRYVDLFDFLYKKSFSSLEKVLFTDLYIKERRRETIMIKLNICKDRYYFIKKSILYKIGIALNIIEPKLD